MSYDTKFVDGFPFHGFQEVRNAKQTTVDMVDAIKEREELYPPHRLCRKCGRNCKQHLSPEMGRFLCFIWTKQKEK